MSRRLWLAATSAWLGLALAGLFFYPLASAIDAGAYYLQWQPAHTAEAAVAWLVLALVIGVLVFLTWHARGPGGTLGLALVTALPVISLLAGLSRQLPGVDVFRQAWEDPAVRYGVPALAAVLCLGLAIVGRALLARALRGGDRRAVPDRPRRGLQRADPAGSLADPCRWAPRRRPARP